MTQVPPYPDTTAPMSTAASPKCPPHSLEAERSVLGALMLDPRAWDRVVDRIAVDDF